MLITPHRLVRAADIHPEKIDLIKAWLSCVSNVDILSMPTWLALGTLHLECCYLGKTGRVRGVFQPSLMCRRMKPKVSAAPGTRSCGGR